MDPAILSQGEKLGEQQQPCALWGKGTEAGLRWGGDRGMVAALNALAGQSRKTRRKGRHIHTRRPGFLICHRRFSVGLPSFPEPVSSFEGDCGLVL